jgi:hypothetical protein
LIFRPFLSSLDAALASMEGKQQIVEWKKYESDFRGRGDGYQPLVRLLACNFHSIPLRSLAVSDSRLIVTIKKLPQVTFVLSRGSTQSLSAAPSGMECDGRFSRRRPGYGVDFRTKRIHDSVLRKTSSSKFDSA